MKCPVCWAEKAYVRKVPGWQGVLYRVALLVPLKCHHCYHKFVVSWFSTVGRTIHPPKIRRTVSAEKGASGAPRPPRRSRSHGTRSHRRSSRKPARNHT